MSIQWNIMWQKKRDEVLIHAPKWMNLENTLSERRQKEHTLCNSILMNVQIGKFIQAKNRLVVARG